MRAGALVSAQEMWPVTVPVPGFAVCAARVRAGISSRGQGRMAVFSVVQLTAILRRGRLFVLRSYPERR
jgi:hypothetical protein